MTRLFLLFAMLISFHWANAQIFVLEKMIDPKRGGIVYFDDVVKNKMNNKELQEMEVILEEEEDGLLFRTNNEEGAFKMGLLFKQDKENKDRYTYESEDELMVITIKKEFGVL